jgi:lysophospholipid acyltransferase (LPLAT)-like uncharacterized protein
MFLGRIIRFAAGALVRTVRTEVEGGDDLRRLLDARAPFVCVFWHGSMLYPWWLLRRRNGAALVSRSRDGQRLSDVLEGWGYYMLRGSSHRGGSEAMETMREAVRAGHVLCVTPDGPRGPRHEMKMGAVRVAQTTGVPLCMVSVAYRRCRHLASWDRFELPAPFTRARLVCSEPVIVDPTLSGDALDAVRRDLEQRMRAQHRRASEIAA